MNSIFASDPAVSYLDSVMIEFKDEIDDPLALILKKEPAARQAYVAVDEMHPDPIARLQLKVGHLAFAMPEEAELRPWAEFLRKLFRRPKRTVYRIVYITSANADLYNTFKDVS
jgi:hypothetical protein